MVSSAATSVDQYLAELPPERRAIVARVRDVVRASIPSGYVESMGWGMICWAIPLSRYPDTYNRQPLGYVCLAAQKNYYVLHLTVLYMDPVRAERFAKAFEATGRKLDMGKGCVRFRRLEDLPLDVVADTVAGTTPDDYIAAYERARAGRTAPGAGKTSAKHTTKTTGATKSVTKKKASARTSAATKSGARKGAAKTSGAKTSGARTSGARTSGAKKSARPAARGRA